MTTYHCSIYAIHEVEVEAIDFTPFSSQAEMTQMLGISVDEWKRRQSLKLKSKMRRKKKESVFDEI